MEELNNILQKLFGNTPWEIIQNVSQGASATIYQINCQGKSYLARISDSSRPNANIPMEFHCMQQASDLNIAPHLLFHDCKKNISVMEFIESKPLPFMDKPSSKEVEKLVNAIAKLHSGKAFPKSPSNFDLLEQISQGVKQYFPNDRYVEAGISKISLLRSLLDCDSDQRPSHRDLHGFNVLYDGQQYYLIDWESAGNESLYFDLAVVINTLLFKILHIESTLLSAYFNSESTAEQLAKLKLMRIFAYLFYGFLLLYIGTSIQEERLNQDQIEGLKTFSEFIEQQIELNQPLTAGQYLKCGYASFIAGLNQFETTDTEKAIELLSKAN